jgi:hypothetical protein
VRIGCLVVSVACKTSFGVISAAPAPSFIAPLGCGAMITVALRAFCRFVTFAVMPNGKVLLAAAFDRGTFEH